MDSEPLPAGPLDVSGFSSILVERSSWRPVTGVASCHLNTSCLGCGGHRMQSGPPARLNRCSYLTNWALVLPETSLRSPVQNAE